MGVGDQHTILPERVFTTPVASSVAVDKIMVEITNLSGFYIRGKGCDWLVHFEGALFSDWSAGGWKTGRW